MSVSAKDFATPVVGSHVYVGGKLVPLAPEMVDALAQGDRLLAIHRTADLLLVPRAQQEIAEAAVSRAHAAMQAMSAVADEQISAFYELCAHLLEDRRVWQEVCDANSEDVARATSKGRSTTRLAVSERMRADMISGLRVWRDMSSTRGTVIETQHHEKWTVEQITAPLGVVAFIFEGRPNVFVDATGILRGGNTAVFRIGSDALETARALMGRVVGPALDHAGLPPGAVCLVESVERSAGWALFSDPRVALAVARGSGSAVSQLGEIARQAGLSVSLHGTGGAWLVADRSADSDKFRRSVQNSLDRKVCNTLNVCCIPKERAAELIPLCLEALEAAAGARNAPPKLHVVRGQEEFFPRDWFTEEVQIRRSEGIRTETKAEILEPHQLGAEWEWEDSPEISVVLVDTLSEAIALFNHWSPQFVASLVSEDPDSHRRFVQETNAPFVGNGFTRWVDGQFATGRPELGLSNWQQGRLFARSAFLSGDGVYTVKVIAKMKDWDLHR